MLTEQVLASLSIKFMIAALLFAVIIRLLITVHFLLIDRKEDSFAADFIFFFIVLFVMTYWIIAIYLIALW